MIFERSEREQKLIQKLRKKGYRRSYVGEHVRRGIAHQIRALREDPSRNWKQGELSKRLGKPQSVVSRMENPEYGSLTVQTLLEVADVFDVALLIQFVSYPTFIARTRDVSEASMQVESFAQSEASGALVRHEKLSAANRSSVLSAASLDTTFNRPKKALVPEDVPLAATAAPTKKPKRAPFGIERTDAAKTAVEELGAVGELAAAIIANTHHIVGGESRGIDRPRH